MYIKLKTNIFYYFNNLYFYTIIIYVYNMKINEFYKNVFNTEVIYVYGKQAMVRDQDHKIIFYE